MWHIDCAYPISRRMLLLACVKSLLQRLSRLGAAAILQRGEWGRPCALTFFASCSDPISTSALHPLCRKRFDEGHRGSLRITTRFTVPNCLRAAWMISGVEVEGSWVRRTILERTSFGSSPKAPGMTSRAGSRSRYTGLGRALLLRARSQGRLSVLVRTNGSQGWFSASIPTDGLQG